MARSNPRVRLNVTISENSVDKLQEISDVTDTSKSKLIEDALRLLFQEKHGHVSVPEKGESLFMAKTIAVCSHKGGVGKTTSTACLADVLSKRNFKVLVVDTDSQGNLSQCFGYSPKTHTDKTLSQFVENLFLDDDARIPMEDFICPTPNKSIDIIPCDDRYAVAIKKTMEAVTLGINIYKLIVQTFSKSYDFILFDTKPAVDDEVKQIMLAVEWIIIPTDVAENSINGAVNTMRFINGCRLGNPALKLAGIFFNAADTRTKVYHDYVPQLKEALGDKLFETVIPFSQDAKKSEGFHVPVTMKYPSGKIARNFSKLVEEVLTRIG